MNPRFVRWLHLPIQQADAASVCCPECGTPGLQHQYVGDPVTKIGYLAIWCPACNHGVHVSRVEIPPGANLLPFGTPQNELDARIPRFNQVWR